MMFSVSDIEDTKQSDQSKLEPFLLTGLGVFL